ncbi:cytochrome P450 [Actinocorallia herbida]|uniref:Cytochrome P450 n=1 Tax=Actinocorallia herbida TaxID=58109 RepID=A0A3N1D3N6_9ACTN|nr:cytochrome P450 [Actinocorallia herbida]ROO88119.1 cytochrome P450 [Actinocorallia herbida]
MFDDEFFRDPYPLYDRLREQCPVQRMDGGRFPFWLITGYAEAREALADPRLSKDTSAFEHVLAPDGRTRDIAPAIARSLLATDPPDHTRLRRPVTRAFTPQLTDRLTPRIEQIAADLVADLADRREADLVADFAVPLPLTVICELLGVPPEDRPALRTWSQDLFLHGDHRHRDAASHHIAAYMTDLVTTRRTTRGDDLLSALLNDQDEAPTMSPEELVSLATLFVVAGHETTANLIANTALMLLTRPALMSDPHTTLEALPQIIEEALRFDAPLGIATIRFTREPVTYADTEIPADQAIMISLAAANRDPRSFTSPHTFTPTPRPQPHLSFGHGPHYCPGARLAKLETHIALTTLLTTFPTLTLTQPPSTLPWRQSRQMRSPQTLPTLLSAAPPPQPL